MNDTLRVFLLHLQKHPGKLNTYKGHACSFLKSFSKTSRQAGFTLIELLVVISIMAIISTISLASFGDYNKSTAINQNAAQLASFLNDARSRASSQLKPAAPTCTGNLDGYSVDFCITATAGCPVVDSYILSVVCSGTKTAVVTKKLPSAVHFTNSGTTSTSYTFAVLTGGVRGAGSITISGYGATAAVTVSPAGAVSIE